MEIKRIINYLKLTFLSKGFLEFCALGLINCFNDSLFSWIAHFVIPHENIAADIGYAIALTIAFFLTSRYIFKAKPTVGKYFKFIVSYIPNFIIFHLVTFITLSKWGLHQFLGTFLAAVAGGPITFVIIKAFAFGKKLDNE